MRLVILESPYRGLIERNIKYARLCVRDSLLRREAPIASHLLYPQEGILDEEDIIDRALGISAGIEWYRVAEACVVYIDFDISKGMYEGIRRAQHYNVPVEYRKILEA